MSDGAAQDIADWIDSCVIKDLWPDLELPPINLYSFNEEDSPCTGECELECGKCVGCKRTTDEITNWTLYDPKERWEILTRIRNAALYI